MSRKFIHLYVDSIDTESQYGTLCREITLGEMYHSKISGDDYFLAFPDMKVKLSAVAQLNWGGHMDKGTLESAVTDLILQLNTGEITGIITSPDMMQSFCELLSDFDISTEASAILPKYLITEAVANRIL